MGTGDQGHQPNNVIFVDSDNALGGGRGNVDDGFALAALLLGGARVIAIASVSGNATEEEANRNNRRLGAMCRFQGIYLRAHQVGSLLQRLGARVTVAALGPLTNIAAAVRGSPRAEEWCESLIVVGGDARSSPDLNLNHDVSASRTVFDSPISWTLVPISVLDRLTVTQRELDQLSGPVGEYLRDQSRSWLAGKPGFRLGDLIAASYLLDLAAFRTESVRARMDSQGGIELGSGSKELAVIRDFDAVKVWGRFVEIINAAQAHTLSR